MNMRVFPLSILSFCLSSLSYAGSVEILLTECKDIIEDSKYEIPGKEQCHIHYRCSVLPSQDIDRDIELDRRLCGQEWDEKEKSTLASEFLSAKIRMKLQIANLEAEIKERRHDQALHPSERNAKKIKILNLKLEELKALMLVKEDIAIMQIAAENLIDPKKRAIHRAMIQQAFAEVEKNPNAKASDYRDAIKGVQGLILQNSQMKAQIVDNPRGVIRRALKAATVLLMDLKRVHPQPVNLINAHYDRKIASLEKQAKLYSDERAKVDSKIARLKPPRPLDCNAEITGKFSLSPSSSNTTENCADKIRFEADQKIYSKKQKDLSIERDRIISHWLAIKKQIDAIRKDKADSVKAFFVLNQPNETKKVTGIVNLSH